MMQCIGVGGVSSFAQSKDPKHKLFCCEIAFVVIYSLMKGKSEKRVNGDKLHKLK